MEVLRFRRGRVEVGGSMGLGMGGGGGGGEGRGGRREVEEVVEDG